MRKKARVYCAAFLTSLGTRLHYLRTGRSAALNAADIGPGLGRPGLSEISVLRRRCRKNLARLKCSGPEEAVGQSGPEIDWDLVRAD